MNVLAIYTVTKRGGGCYGLCSQKVEKESMRIAYSEYGVFMILSDRVVMIGESCADYIMQGGVRLEVEFKLSRSAMSRLIKI